MDKPGRRNIREVVIYIIFGVLTTLVHTAALWLAEWLWIDLAGFHSGYSFWFTNPFAWVVAVAFAYVTNKLFVFEQKSWARRIVKRELSSFVAARLFTLGVEQGIMLLLFGLLEGKILAWFGPFWQERLGLPGDIQRVYRLLVKLSVISAVVMILNYIFSKFFIFRPPAAGLAGCAAAEESNLKEEEKTP